jgi:hypothetical protein
MRRLRLTRRQRLRQLVRYAHLRWARLYTAFAGASGPEREILFARSEILARRFQRLHAALYPPRRSTR